MTRTLRHSQTLTPNPKQRQQRSAGFSLVEVLMAIMIISIAVITAVSLSNLANISTKRSSAKSIADTYVDRDIARAREINERLVCNTGSCQILSTTPDRNSYSPAFSSTDTSDTTAFNDFDTLCQTTNAFSDQIKSLTGGLPDGDVADSNGTISRAMVQEGSGHRYTLIYTEKSTGQIIRSVTLVPATVAWCPGVVA